MLHRQTSRRGVLRGAAYGGAGLAAAALVGCGGSSGGTGGGGEDGGTPKPGGVLRASSIDVTGLDVYRAASFTTHALGSYVYNRLFRFKTQRGELPTDQWYTPEPELVAEWEQPDPTTYVLTLKDGVKWHNVPPLNGRPLTAQDIVDSFTIFRQRATNRDNFSMVDTVEATPDGRQVTFKLKEPFALFIERLASFQDFWVVPREIAGNPDLANQTLVGSGPFILESYERGVAWRFRKNPDYFERDEFGNQLPYVDALEYPILGDSNAIITQFAAGNLATAGVPSDLVDAVLSQTPNARVEKFLRATLSLLFFSPNEDLWRDERVRRAMSMAIDRDTLNNAMSRDGGEWQNVIPAGMGTRWWLDPKSSEMGDAAQWYQYNPEEAKRLLAEAGFPDGFRAPMHYSANIYSTVVRYYDPVAQALPAMLRGIRVTVDQVAEDYISQYFPNTFLKGPADGFAWGLESTYSDVAQYVTNMYLPRDQGGGRNHSNIQDPTLVSMVRDLIQELDAEEFQKKLFEIQRYVSDKMYVVPVIAPWEYTARQPWLKGAVNVTGPTTYAVGTESTMWVWLDR